MGLWESGALEGSRDHPSSARRLGAAPARAAGEVMRPWGSSPQHSCGTSISCSRLLRLVTRGFAATRCFSPSQRFADVVMARGVDYPDRVDGKTPVPRNDASQNPLASK